MGHREQSRRSIETMGRKWLGWVAAVLTIAVTVGTARSIGVEGVDWQAEANRVLVEGLQLYREGTAQAYRQAIDRWQEAAELFDRSGNPAMAANVLTNIGAAQLQLGDLNSALDTYQAALPRLEAMGDTHAIAQTLTQLAEVRSLRGEYQTALDTYHRALPLWEQTSYQTGIAETLNALGTVYSDLGEAQKAAETYAEALALVETLGNRANVAATLNNLGGAYLDLGEFDRAIESYNRALEIWQSIDHRSGEASTLNNIGYLYRQQGDLEKASSTFARAVEIWRDVHNLRAEASTLNNIGDVHFLQGDRDRALAFYQRALPLRESAGDRRGLARTRYSLARVYRQRGDLDRAQQEIETTLEIVETLRTNVLDEELRASFFANQQDYFEFYIDLLMQRHRQDSNTGFDELALHAKERASTRSFLDLLNAAASDLKQGIDSELFDRYQKSREQLHLLERRRVEVFGREHTDEEAQTLQAAFQDALADYSDIQARIRTTSPRFADLTQPQPVTVADVQQQLLDDETAMLVYALGTERSYVWIVTSNELTSYDLPPRAEIERLANGFLEAIYVPRYRTRPQLVATATRDLSQAVLPKDLDRLSQKRLAIVGDGVLQYVPFAALYLENETPSIDRFEIVNLPSASTLAALRRNHKTHRTPSKTLAVFADPVFSPDDDRFPNAVVTSELPPELDRSARQSEVRFNRLPFTRTEAERISRWIPDERRFSAWGFDASRDLVTNTRLDDYRIVHFATHGLANSATPELSGLVLSLFDLQGNPQNGFLRLYDIFNLDLYAELVVLSACNTGRGRQIRGEGIVGLTRGFMYAGADRVVVSFWAVDDAGTAELMDRFYRQMLENRHPPIAALREAQLELINTQEWNLPYYWAAFTVQGDWNLEQ